MNNTWVNRLERQLSSVQWLRSRLTETLPPSTCDFSCHPEIISIPPEGREKKKHEAVDMGGFFGSGLEISHPLLLLYSIK